MHLVHIEIDNMDANFVTPLSIYIVILSARKIFSIHAALLSMQIIV